MLLAAVERQVDVAALALVEVIGRWLAALDTSDGDRRSPRRLRRPVGAADAAQVARPAAASARAGAGAGGRRAAAGPGGGLRRVSHLQGGGRTLSRAGGTLVSARSPAWFRRRRRRPRPAWAALPSTACSPW
ncbi:MAG: hypothetical protein U0531_15190 [Dehalococcoidia bacterium]